YISGCVRKLQAKGACDAEVAVEAAGRSRPSVATGKKKEAREERQETAAFNVARHSSSEKPSTAAHMAHYWYARIGNYVPEADLPDSRASLVRASLSEPWR